jgi:hypothetical protein
MADRPILFSGPMVRALRDGRKTQTRRLAKFVEEVDGIFDVRKRGGGHFGLTEDRVPVIAPAYAPIATGDRLWVKETWRTESRAYDDLAPSEMGGEEAIFYEADPDWSLTKTTGKTRVSIHMPRWASRLTLIVTDVRVERLQDISEADAIAEGIDRVENNFGNGPAYCDYLMGRLYDTAEWYNSPIDSYHSLWDSIKGKDAWEANPWVAAYTFTIIKQNIDQIGADV